MHHHQKIHFRNITLFCKSSLAQSDLPLEKPTMLFLLRFSSLPHVLTGYSFTPCTGLKKKKFLSYCYWSITSGRSPKVLFFQHFSDVAHFPTASTQKRNSEELGNKAEAALPLLARCRSLSRQQVEQLCWGQLKPLSEPPVVPGSLRTHSSW